MSGIRATSISLRSARLRALLPRIAVLFLIAVLSIAGLKSILAGTDAPAAGGEPAADLSGDLGVRSFAESFARAYLSWNAADPDRRERLLEPYLADSLDADAGLEPAEGSNQTVGWTSVAGAERSAGRTLVTVAAQAGERLLYLSVPVARDRAGFLYLAGYPALVGPPATASDVEEDVEEDVEDAKLEVVVSRAITNYLAGSRRNLLADLTPDAVISMPSRPLEVESTGDLLWVEPDRRVSIEVEVRDETGTDWTLRYELGVQRSDRWYVRSIHINPLAKGDT